MTVRAKWGSLDELLAKEVKALRILGPKKAVRIDPKAASARSVSAKVSILRKASNEDFMDVRVTVLDGAAFLYLGGQDESPEGK